jgi:hypothetical protein
MDKNELRKYAGLPLNESANVEFSEKEGPIIRVSLGGFSSNTRREAGFSSFQIQIDKPSGPVTDDDFREQDRGDKKIAEQKLKAIVKLSKKFQKDVLRVLEK